MKRSAVTAGDSQYATEHLEATPLTEQCFGDDKQKDGHIEGDNAVGYKDDNVGINVDVQDYSNKSLIYGVNETPPIHITIVCALQQGLLSLSGHLVVSLLVAEAVCASDNNLFKARLLSSTLFMSGVTTLAMTILGIRLPLFQSASSEYIVPLLLVSTIDDTFCSSLSSPATGTTVQFTTSSSLYNVTLSSASMFNNSMTTSSQLDDASMERILNNVRMLQGSLMVAGLFHAFLGFTGLVGVLIRYVGPLTVVPCMTLLFIFIVKPVLKFVEVNWPIAMSTVFVALILCLYLSRYNMPIPIWTPSGGCRVIRYPLHQVFAILISIILHWILCAILTVTGCLTDDPQHIGYNTRTDARSNVLRDNPWFTLPYPGQFGAPSFHIAAFISFMIATLISVLDSIGDYYACARVCRVPAPPAHAVNRGILMEGVCSFLSGAVGCGHGTSTNGGNLGAIGVTKVASRQVFICTGILYILFGVFGKFSALFITIPYPVLGGAVVVLFGIFFGVIISNLEVTKLSSPRNQAVLGLSIFIGLMISTWVDKVKNPINTGNQSFDRVMAMLMGNPNLCGTILAFVLDNTVPGTKEERGIKAWHVGKEDVNLKIDHVLYNEGYEVYQPLLPARVLRWKIIKYCPFLPYKST